MEAVIAVAASFVLGACGPSASGTRPCEDGFIEHVVIENQQDIADFPRVNHVRRLEIIGSDLETLEGLECIEWVETLRIEDNPRLARLTGLEGLKEVRAERCDEPWATVDCVPYADAIAAQSRPPPGVGEATIAGNPELESMVGLDSLAWVHSMLDIRDNLSLVSLDGLQSLMYVGLLELTINLTPTEPLGGLWIVNNPRLENLEHLAAYRGETRLEIHSNVALTRLFTPYAREEDDEPPRRLGMLVLEQLPALAEIDGLTDWDVRGLELRRAHLIEELPQMLARPAPSLGESDDRYLFRLVLDENRALRSISGLPPVASIGDGVIIRDNDMLHELEGLEHLELVSARFSGEDPGYALLIEDNAELQSLDALDPSIGGSFRGHSSGDTSAIRNNPRLPTCVIEALLNEIYTIPIEDITSWIIEGNGEELCS